MRSVFRSVLVALVAMLAFGAVAASGASALGFRIEGKPLTGTEAFTGSTGIARVHVNVDGTNLKFECKQSVAAGTLETSASWKSEITFKECAATEPTGCKLSATSEKTIPLYTYGSLESMTHIYQDGSGPGGRIFAFEIAGCVLAGVWEVYGYWKCDFPTGGEEHVYQEEVCSKSEGFLKTDGLEGNLSYTEQIKLASGKKWSVE